MIDDVLVTATLLGSTPNKGESQMKAIVSIHK